MDDDCVHSQKHTGCSKSVDKFCHYCLESYKTLVDCEFQIEIQFNKHKVECPVDETLRIYLSKLRAKLDAVIEKDKDNEVVRSCLGSLIIHAYSFCS